jgi:glycosyltransferase involved in cell wall biosynthesis
MTWCFAEPEQSTVAKMQLQQQQLLSIVVPCFNEEAVIRETHRGLSQMADRLDDLDYEIIYVDDGSIDETPLHLEEIQRSDPHVRVIRLSRNFGHQLAVTAGLEHATGDAVVLIDADLQDPPDVIPLMVGRWREGYDVAYGERVSRDGETRFKIATARAFYRILNWLTETRIPLDAGDFRLLDRKVIEALRAMPEGDRFVRGLVSWAGFRQVAVPYRRASRYAGESKYPLSRMLRLALDGIMSFSMVPLRMVSVVGLAASLLAVAGTLYVLLRQAVSDGAVPPGATMLIGLLFLGGVQLVAIGIVGEYVGRIHGQSRRRPLYFVRDRIGFDMPAGLVRERRRGQPRRQAERASRFGSRVIERERATS